MATWPSDQQPKIHYSSPRTETREKIIVDKITGKKISSPIAPVFTGHADFCNPFEFAMFMRKVAAFDFDVMLEAKAKDLALVRLRPDLLRYAPDVGERSGLNQSQIGELSEEETGQWRQAEGIEASPGPQPPRKSIGPQCFHGDLMSTIELKAIVPGSVGEGTRCLVLQIGFDRHRHPSESPADQLNAAEKVAGY